MSLIISRKEHGGYLGTLCHVCGQNTKENNIIEHTGHISRFPNSPSETLTEGLGDIVLHEECATILILRLAADVMNVNRKDARMVDKLAAIRKSL